MFDESRLSPEARGLNNGCAQRAAWFDRLLKEVQDIAAQTCAVHQGTIQTALVESVNEHDSSLVTGRLSNNLLVHFPGDASLIGSLVPVSLKECRGFYYLGERA